MCTVEFHSSKILHFGVNQVEMRQEFCHEELENYKFFLHFLSGSIKFGEECD